jgi:glycyl-tRNA synthetase
LIPTDDGLLAEVTNLVEAPTPLRGSFDKGFLALPRAVLVAVMKKHQRYFPVEKEGRLLPDFVAVRNGGAAQLETVRLGNEHVLKARFADAAYFVRRDRAKRLEDFLPRLATLIYQTRLGSMLDKARRVEALIDGLAAMVGLTEEGRQAASRAAHLCKADLATQMVVEMTSLQGEIGRVYALEDGEPAAVADAIFEHYLPRFAGDRIPSSPESLTVGLADRLDTLMGMFAAGLQPTAARDPFGLRRAAIGLAQMLIGRGVRFDLRQGLRLAAGIQPIPIPDGAPVECLAFITARQQALMLGEGRRYDVVEAVLAAQGHDPAGAAQAIEALEQQVAQPGWAPTLQAYARCVRITRDQVTIPPVDSTRLVEPAEKALLQSVETAERVLRAPGSVDDFLGAFRPMIPEVTRFFEDVLVMVDDPTLRAARLGLLQRIVTLAAGVADFSRLEGF